MYLFQMLVNIYDYADDQTIYVIEPWLLEPIYHPWTQRTQRRAYTN